MTARFKIAFAALGLLGASTAHLHGQGAPPERTTITSVSLEMQGTDDRNFFHFRDHVEVRGTNLELFCDELTVISFRAGAADATVGEIGAIESIIAAGNVRIRQEGREAFAGRAEINPVAGTVTLSESPRIVDGEVEVEGFQFILFRDQRRFQSVPDPNAPAGQPSRSVVRLGELPDLGFSQDESAISVGRDARAAREQRPPPPPPPSGEAKPAEPSEEPDPAPPQP